MSCFETLDPRGVRVPGSGALPGLLPDRDRTGRRGPAGGPAHGAGLRDHDGLSPTGLDGLAGESQMHGLSARAAAVVPLE